MPAKVLLFDGNEGNLSSMKEGLFSRLRSRAVAQRQTTARERIALLDALYAEVWRRRTDLHAAMYADFRKPAEEVDLTEIYVLKGEIDYVKRRLRGWMRPRRVRGGAAMLGSAAWVQQEAKGVVLILAPWNYPMQLLFRPLVSALAAGCTAMLKPSELTPNTAQVLAEIVEAAFEPDVVALIQGGPEVAQALLAEPFDHIYFTGSPAVGRLVMAAAAKHPCSVTLELGGKSPAIVDGTVKWGVVARRLAWGKCVNAGQICVSPDYALVPRASRDAFVDALREAMVALYGTDPSSAPDFQRIVNPRHAARIAALIDDAVARGARVVHGGEANPEASFIAPTILVDVPRDAAILEEEIFGPVLPVLTYEGEDELIAEVKSRPIPLALYLFSADRKRIRRLLARLQSGGAAINQTVLHVSHRALPFGGQGNSGIGAGHGHFGFLEFTHQRGVYQQLLPSAADAISPPYTPFKRKLIQAVLRWL